MVGISRLSTRLRYSAGLAADPARVVIFSTTSPMCGASMAGSSDGARRRWRRVRAGRGWRAESGDWPRLRPAAEVRAPSNNRGRLEGTICAPGTPQHPWRLYERAGDVMPLDPGQVVRLMPWAVPRVDISWWIPADSWGYARYRRPRYRLGSAA